MPSVSPHIRPFKSSDLTAVCELLNQLSYPNDPEELSMRMIEITDHSDYRTLVAEVNKQIVAVAGMVKIRYWERSGFYFKLQVLSVHSSFQKQGIGSKILKECEAIAKSEGAGEILLTSSNKPHRNAAHAFYPKQGYTVRSTVYVKEL